MPSLKNRLAGSYLTIRCDHCNAQNKFKGFAEYLAAKPHSCHKCKQVLPDYRGSKQCAP